MLWNEQEVGTVTSAMYSDAVERVVALAYVNVEGVGSDAQLAVGAGGAALPVQNLRTSVRDGRGRGS